MLSLRQRFPKAEIVGVEINSRSRRLARRRIAADQKIAVIRPSDVKGPFDLVFALAVLQREPHRVLELGVTDISRYYPFDKFDAVVRQLVQLLSPSGLLCVMHAQYRVEDSSVALELEPIASSPPLEEPLFDRAGRRGRGGGRSLFRKRGV